MTNIRNLVAFGAAMAVVAASHCVFAQDDLDDLLKDLESESGKKPAAKTAQADAVAETAAAEPQAAEAKAEEASSESGTAETTAAAAPVAEEKAAEKPAEKPIEEKKVDETLNLLKELAAESDAPAKPAEKPAAAPAKAKAAVNPDAELIANLRATEKLRRVALDSQAKREIADARECMENEEYSDAVRHYGLAAKLLNDRPGSVKLRKECDQGIAEGLYRAAMQEKDLGRNERAQKLMEKALDMRHPRARKMLEKWIADAGKEVEVRDISELKHRINDADYKANRAKIRKHLRRSRQYLAVRDLDRALDECEVVLVNDPYNQEAIRLRRSIQRKRQTILKQEREAARDGMIADVDEAWRPVYAVNAAELTDAASETVKTQVGEDPERTQEQDIEKRMREMRLPTISFKPPATIMEAVEFFRQASKDYDRPDIPLEKRGFNFVLKTPQPLKAAQAAEETSSDDFSSTGEENAAPGPANGLDPIPTIQASDITFYEALKLVCDSVDYKFIVRGPVVMVMQKDMSTAELLSRKYDVLDAFLERMTSASSDVKEMKSAGFGGGNKAAEESEENQERDWKAFFEQMGVKWPEGSSIMYIKTLGKLYVRNTRENLAEFEKVLQEMGSQPKLIEIETRFVEVAQEDLNSLGFEWILNNNYSLASGHGLGKLFGVRNRVNGAVTAGGGNQGAAGLGPGPVDGGGGLGDGANPDAGGVNAVRTRGSYGSINAIGDGANYTTGNRYLSTVGNHISGESASANDQFMRVNAFLGSADLSMILHMLAQRSDTDLLSAPKVVTKSGENAVIKVVTEYIYPQDYDVQLQSSSSGSSGGSSGGGQSAILAVVEPQNFTMREVGVILDVTPTYSEANGGTIDLELKPQVVDEPIWKNYGMRIPFTGNTSSGTMASIGEIFSGMSTALNTIDAKLTAEDRNLMAKQVVDSAMSSAANVSSSSSSTMTWYDAPMEQPFFHVRSIDSKVSITPGSTVVMGGLITEARKAMDDKIPFLGDIPYIGRLFRSHAEQTVKRNLLIFVTGRLITPSGRELTMNTEPADEAEVKAAPEVK
jgi:general secretion pathway protein D